MQSGIRKKFIAEQILIRRDSIQKSGKLSCLPVNRHQKQVRRHRGTLDHRGLSTRLVWRKADLFDLCRLLRLFRPDIPKRKPLVQILITEPILYRFIIGFFTSLINISHFQSLISCIISVQPFNYYCLF